MEQCKRCLLTSDIVAIGNDGECEFCKLHDKLERDHNPKQWESLLKKIKSKAENNKYDCLIGISGGFDSAILLHMAVKEWGLKPLVIHFDNHYNSIQAEHNMFMLLQKLNVEMIRYYVCKQDYDAMNRAFLWAGVPDADIPNDMVMTSLMYDTANRYGIKYILNGHNFRTEGSTPVKWTYMDAKYMRDVYDKYSSSHSRKDTAPDLPLFTFREQLFYTLKGIRQVRPFYYNNFDFETEKEKLIADYDLKDYYHKHGENYYTMFVGYDLLPNKFKIDKRIVYLSAQIRSGLISKTYAAELLNSEITLPSSVKEIIKENYHLVDNPVRDRSEFKKFNFKRYRVLIWVMAKLGVVPYTFYKKYCK